MELFKTLLLFVVTAVAEIVGCYLPYIYFKQQGSVWLLLPAVISLGMFVWLLSLHPNTAGRVYAAYGGVYIGVAIMWLWIIDSVKPNVTDWLGAAICLLGASVIILGAKTG